MRAYRVAVVFLQTQGERYFVRVSAYNVKGWGPPQCSAPVSAAPSSEYPELCQKVKF